MKWSEERTVQLAKLHAKGLSFSQIAADLGVTRGAVASKVVQMGLAGRPRGRRMPKQKQPPARSTQFREPAMKKVYGLVPVPVIDQQADTPVSLFDLELHHCRWPVNDSPFMFCAGTKQDGSSYCSRHFGISKRGVACQP